MMANGDEDEHTSLLASSSAPGPVPFPTASDAKEPLSQASLSSTHSAIRDVERAAKDLAGPSGDRCDTDSVDGLLAGMEPFDDEYDGDIGAGDEDAEDPSANDEHRRADDIGRKLSWAVNDPELSDRILRQSLDLSDHGLKGATTAAAAEEGRVDPTAPPWSAGRPVIERVHESTRALRASLDGNPHHPPGSMSSLAIGVREGKGEAPFPVKQVAMMVALTLIVMTCLIAALGLGTVAVGPPRQPVGEYKIVDAQVGEGFWQHYEFYAGKDSAGSNGYINYVTEEVARKEGILKVVTEKVPREAFIPVGEDGEVEDWLQKDLDFRDSSKNDNKGGKFESDDQDEDRNGGGSDKNDLGDSSRNVTTAKQRSTTKNSDSKAVREDETSIKGGKTDKFMGTLPESINDSIKFEPFNPDDPVDAPDEETFVYISSSATKEGPRNSVRLEGRRRFNRGLFIIDLRHMPAGCGTWPAFWLTDEANWPVNGEIDIVEGVSYQDTAKTALHATRECRMDNVPAGTKTGSWDTAVGIPDKKTGIPDMTFRYATDCFVYDPHQWLNQGCVATDLKSEGRSLGVPLNANGGGVYALEWDPMNRHIRSWVFSPHSSVPSNLREALRTASNEEEETRIAPDTNEWGLPYGNFPIGDGTDCPSEHFRNMRLVINLAFCGSVAGNRYFMDCPKQFKEFKTCNEWIASNPEEIQKGAHWKIRGVYVYEREWLNRWDTSPL